MATYTPNLNLKKPATIDFYDIEDQNSNMQKIDVAYGNVKVLTGTTTPTTSTVGIVGQFYLNTATGISYQCSAVNGSVYTWVLVSPTPYKIGDELCTARTDLGSDWLLENGALIDIGEYSELYNLMSGTPVYKSISLLAASGLSGIYGSAVIDGVCFLLGAYKDAGNLYYPAFAYASSFSETAIWTIVKVNTTGNASDSRRITNIQKVNNVYFVTSNQTLNGAYYASSYNGTWVWINIAGKSTKVEYGNGYYVSVGYDDSGNVNAFYSTDAVSWSAKLINNTRRFADFCFNGTYFVALMAYYPDGYTGYQVECVYCSVPTTWTSHGVVYSGGAGADQAYILSFTYIEGTFAAVIGWAMGSSTAEYIKLYTSTTATGGAAASWSAKNLRTLNQGETLYGASMLKKINGKYVLVIATYNYNVYFNLYYADTLTGTYSVYSLGSSGAGCISDIVYDAVSSTYKAFCGAFMYKASALLGSYRAIPTETANKKYCYIKAK